MAAPRQHCQQFFVPQISPDHHTAAAAAAQRYRCWQTSNVRPRVTVQCHSWSTDLGATAQTSQYWMKCSGGRVTTSIYWDVSLIIWTVCCGTVSAWLLAAGWPEGRGPGSHCSQFLCGHVTRQLHQQQQRTAACSQHRGHDTVIQWYTPTAGWHEDCWTVAPFSCSSSVSTSGPNVPADPAPQHRQTAVWVCDSDGCMYSCSVSPPWNWVRPRLGWYI